MEKEMLQEFYSLIFRSIRKYKKLTQKQLGEILGKKTITIQAYENQRLSLNTEILFSLVKRLYIHRDEMVDLIIKDVINYNNDFKDYPEELNNFLNEIYPFDEKKEENSDNKINIKVNREVLKGVINFIDVNEKESRNAINLKHELLHYLNFKDEFLKIETTGEEKSKRIEKILSFIDFLYFQDIIKK